MENIIKNQKTFYLTQSTKQYVFRLKQLDKLYHMIKINETKILDALYLDLHKTHMEGYATEVGYVYKSIRSAMKSLKQWMKVKKVKTPLFMFGSKSYMMKEPLGQVLIIGPYNYPFQLIIEPLIGAIAAGNTVVIKPSEYTSNVEKLIKQMFDDTFDQNYIKVVTGDKEITSQLLNLNFDYIFFTGSTRVGKIVYEKAAKHLTPVTLELGGKSPAIVLKDANIKLAARRLVFAKFLNAGQTCIAPDYIYVEKQVKAKLLEQIKLEIKEQYPNLDHFAHIVNEGHYQRLEKLVDKDKIYYQSEKTEDHLHFPFTVLDDVNESDAVMQEEIFGPILPVITIDNLADAVDRLNEKPKSLALYLFTENKDAMKKVFNDISFGSGGINEALMQIANPNLPFGGVGDSGLSRYHGIHSFDIFSHHKTYTKKTTKFDIKLAYPPYNQTKEKIIKKFLK